jgi:hypothetical protein
MQETRKQAEPGEFRWKLLPAERAAVKIFTQNA